MPTREARVLILSKTYPSPSAKHVETSCIGGMEPDGKMIRLYPLPFRLLNDERQFKKWQWITVKVEQAKKDHRPESHKVFVDTIKCDAEPLPTTKHWAARRAAIAAAETFSDFDELEAARQSRGITIGLLRPSRIVRLTIKAVPEAAWTTDQLDKLRQEQGDFFGHRDEDAAIKRLRKLPFDFHYEYECETPTGTKKYKHKIIDWEAGALFWKLFDEFGADYEGRFRDKFEMYLRDRDVTFLMGTIHRFPNKWIIGALLYPPKPPVSNQLLLI